MKIVCIEGDELFIEPDTTVIHGGEPFFAPDFTTNDGIKEVAGVAVKITRMVKCIEQKFAYRAWSEFSLCTDYQIINHPNSAIGRSFDRSFAVADKWSDKSQMEVGETAKFDAAIARVSQYFTLRVGDYVFIGNDD